VKRIQYIRWRRWRMRQQIRFWLVDTYGCCWYCGRFLTYETSTIDHVIPLERGGSDDEDNFELACFRCNLNKGNHDFEFLACQPVRGWGLHNPKDVPRQIANHARRIKQRQIERKAAQAKCKKK